MVYTLAFVSGSMGAFQWPAYRSWSTHLVDERHFGRIGGIMKLGEGIPFLLGPVLGGALIELASLATVFAVNLCAHLAAIAVLIAVGGKNAAPVASAAEKEQAGQGWAPLVAFLRVRPGLVGLLVLSPFIVFTEGWVIALFQPFMLHHVDAASMGLMLSLGGIGMVVGGIVMGVWGGPRRQIFNVMAAILAQTVIIAYLAFSSPGFWSGTVVAFFYFFAIPFLSGSNQAIWQSLTPHGLQGRMFAFRRATESVATPASLLTAGILVDFILEPLLDLGGPLAFVDSMISRGPTQAIAVLFLTVSILNVFTLAAAVLYRPVRQVDLLVKPSENHAAGHTLNDAGANADADARVDADRHEHKSSNAGNTTKAVANAQSRGHIIDA